MNDDRTSFEGNFSIKAKLQQTSFYHKQVFTGIDIIELCTQSKLYMPTLQRWNHKNTVQHLNNVYVYKEPLQQ